MEEEEEEDEEEEEEEKEEEEEGRNKTKQSGKYKETAGHFSESVNLPFQLLL